MRNSTLPDTQKFEVLNSSLQTLSRITLLTTRAHTGWLGLTYDLIWLGYDF